MFHRIPETQKFIQKAKTSWIVRICGDKYAKMLMKQKFIQKAETNRMFGKYLRNDDASETNLFRS
jgi:hypothetical protein